METSNQIAVHSGRLARLNEIRHDPRVRVLLLTLYYLLIILALIVMYGRGDFSTPPFIYQGF